MLNLRADPRPTAPASPAAPEQDGVIATLVSAFEADAAVRTLYVERDAYLAHFPGFLLAFGGRAFDHGTVDTTPEGAALWFPPGVEPDGEAILAHMVATIPAARLDALARGMEIQAGLHPHAPHWYLPWIGVRPEAQGRGLGGALLRRGLERADRDGLPAYIEATSWRNAALYVRHGFEVTGTVLVPGYPEIIAMWRPAGGRGPRAAEG